MNMEVSEDEVKMITRKLAQERVQMEREINKLHKEKGEMMVEIERMRSE